MRLNDQAYKENWSAEKMNSEFSKKLTEKTKGLVDDKQCFAVEINADDREALKLQYWYGNLEQDGTSQALSFSEGTSFIKTTTTTTVSGSHGLYVGSSTNSDRYFYYADACGTKPIKLAERFAISIEPRYARDLEPIKLDWKTPDLEKKSH